MAKNVIIKGVTYTDVPQVNIPLVGGGGDAVFYETSIADARRSDVLSGKTFFSNGQKTGAMVNNGRQNGTISTKAGSVTIAEGYHNGSGRVTISTTEQNKIVTGNIKSGVSILGVRGKASVVDTADADATARNILSGKTAYVNGSKLTGSLTAVSVTQDVSTKVLTIE